MEITRIIADDLARQIIPEGLDSARQALEDMTVAAYRAHPLTRSQLRRPLGIPSRYELNAFLKKRGVWLEYTIGVTFNRKLQEIVKKRGLPSQLREATRR